MRRVSPSFRRWAALLGAAALVLLAVAPGAQARKSIKKAIWGPTIVHDEPQFPIYADLGVGIFQIQLNWADVAQSRPAQPRDPSDPAYRWPWDLKLAVSEGQRYGIRIAVQVINAPRWANGGRAANFPPLKPQDFADFTEAASRRYPSVKLWMVWGEPSRAHNWGSIVPETQGRTKLTPAQARAPRLYARILDAAYGALKRVSRSNLVIGGNTFTVGDVSPYNWIRYMKLPGGRSPRLDLYGHNPFSARRPDLSLPPNGRGPNVNYADFSDLDTLALVLDRHLRDPRGRRLRLFLSEYFLPTDHANWEFPFHVSLGVQANWLSDALRIVRRWPRVYTFGWYGLYDDDVRPDGLEVNRGLLRRSGSRKPAYRAYRDG